MKASVFALVLFTTVTLNACSTMTQSPEKIASTQQSMLGSWTLQKASLLPEIPANILVTLRPDTNGSSNKLGASGFSGVNHFVGTASVDWEQQKIGFSALASTRMMGPEPRMQFEQAFLKQMEQVVGFTLGQDGTLTLSTVEGEKIIFQHGTQ